MPAFSQENSLYTQRLEDFFKRDLCDVTGVYCTDMTKEDFNKLEATLKQHLRIKRIKLDKTAKEDQQALLDFIDNFYLRFFYNEETKALNLSNLALTDDLADRIIELVKNKNLEVQRVSLKIGNTLSPRVQSKIAKSVITPIYSIPADEAPVQAVQVVQAVDSKIENANISSVKHGVLGGLFGSTSALLVVGLAIVGLILIGSPPVGLALIGFIALSVGLVIAGGLIGSALGLNLAKSKVEKQEATNYPTFELPPEVSFEQEVKRSKQAAPTTPHFKNLFTFFGTSSRASSEPDLNAVIDARKADEKNSVARTTNEILYRPRR